jgi:hypothetical protein
VFFRVFKISAYSCLSADIGEYLLFISINQCGILSHAAICRSFLMEWLTGSADWTARSNAMMRYDVNKQGEGAENPGTERCAVEGGGRGGEFWVPG